MKGYFLIMLSLFITIAFSVEEYYEQGKIYGNEHAITLGGMDHQVKDFHHSEQEAANLSTDNDTILADRGSNAIKGEFGELLYESEAATINATEEHQINQQNTFYKKSLILEQDPLSTIEGQEIQQKSSVTKEVTEKCDEGVSFDIDLINQLTYSPPPRQQMDTELTIYYPDYVQKVGRVNDEIGPMSVNTRNHQINIQRFREHACPHFKPIDAITGKSYKIDCHRISNFTLVEVVDFNRVHITDKYGSACNPVKLIKLSYKHDTYQSEEGSKEFWNILNPKDEELVEQHNCHETKRICLDVGTKHFDELAVDRPCWKEQISYHCITNPQDGCKHLKDKNCTLQQGSICQAYVDPNRNLCTKWQHTYKCSLHDEISSSGIAGSNLFCLDGDCFTPNNQQNTDMNEAVSKMSIMREMASKENFIAGEPPKVFPGKAQGCNKILAGFKNCCQSKGWGVSLNLAGCSEEDKELAMKRSQHLCHYVGTYCAEKMPITGICIRKKSVYCCFQSKLSRIFHEQGRPQLSRSWGEPESPDCSSFTVDELTNMDFSHMDLSEIFSDLFSRVGKTAAKVVPRQMIDQMPIMQQNIDKMREENSKSWNEGSYDDKTTRSSF